MSVMLPIRKIDTATLDSKVGDLSLPPSDELMDPSECAYLPSSLFPASLQKVRIGDLFYIAGNVHAVTSRQYLESADPDVTLAQLCIEEGDFFPYNPDDLQSVE